MARNLGQARAMTEQVLVVDDEPDVGALFRGKMSKGLHTLDLISAYGDADTVAPALARDADEFLTKPVDFLKLKQDIMAVMADATGGNG
jgi:hypothetical protein